MQIGVGELVPAVKHLVECERSGLAAADTIAAAQGVVATDPDLLLHRIVAQFQHLFDCPRLEGVLPALNQVQNRSLLLVQSVLLCCCAQSWHHRCHCTWDQWSCLAAYGIDCCAESSAGLLMLDWLEFGWLPLHVSKGIIHSLANSGNAWKTCPNILQ